MIGTFKISLSDLLHFAQERGIQPLGNSPTNTFHGVAPLDEASETDIAFCRFDDERGRNWLQHTQASAVFILPHVKEFAEKVRPILYLPCDVPRLEFSLLLQQFWREPEWNTGSGLNPDIHPEAKLGSDVKVGQFTTIGPDVTIGNGTRIAPGCHIMHASVGENCWIGSNTVIGSSGFGFEDDDISGQVTEFPHVGTVSIGKNVRIGASCCIDRSALGATKIGDETKLDNNIHIGHNVNIGKRCKLTASVTISGSVIIEDDCWLAPNSVVRDWRSIGRKSLIGIGSVITRNVPENATMFGNPAREIPRPKNRYR
ncbi:DapH/DapD/GlmU-related protein [Thalassospira sp.]|uniref:DapH/DapD/GlmU-related protein n=1 Tax=Thalassospira sp. TaxID=1912094 RepID=UPI001B22375C|nr:DapH/DapD/GlmU-related protein [Thalassospira sp.]MBO6805982.1 hypothetical protein [Thalassospira sp.]